VKIARPKRNFTICASIVSVACGLGGFTSRVDAQTMASRTASRSSAGAASTSQDADSANGELRERVAAALRTAPYLDSEHIDTSVKKGAVVLSGIVFDDWDLLDALRIARKAAGNRPVIDSLSIEEGGR
jgi:osmotically-inducible protein OsmY